MIQTKMIIELIRRGESLKCINRSGWVLSGIESERIESVAEHSYGSILSAIIITQQLISDKIDINLEKVVLMAALHDLPESITGDIARTEAFVEDKELVRTKELAEKHAIKSIFEPLGNSFENLLNIWDEFNLGKSLEARVVKGADIIDMLVHARSLEESGASPQSLHQFFISSRALIDSVAIEIVTEIYNTLFHEHQQKARAQGIILK
ncbi:MAG: HD domain-containing protein [Candidatus Thorarchaeota archaeon]